MASFRGDRMAFWNLQQSCRMVPALLIVLSFWYTIASNTATACPFCSATSQTLSEELANANAAVIAILKEPVPSSNPSDPAGLDNSGPLPGAKFVVDEVLRGPEHVDAEEEIEVVYFGEEQPGRKFFITAVVGDQLDWLTPLPLTDQSVKYIKKLDTLPEKGVDRLQFFLQYLENEDPLLAQDAYEEFARAPYSEVIALKEHMDREQLVEWILDSQVGPTRRRLYLTLLGVCGTSEDVQMLESLLLYGYDRLEPGIQLMNSLMHLGGTSLGASIVDELSRADVRSKQQCLDALIAAYLKLKGPEGLSLVEERFLTNPDVEYTHLYSTIMALRFHGEESNEIPRERLIQSMRLLLDNEEIADQVIPDLARWEDWDSLDRLHQMFKDSEEDSWIRQPVISYMLTAAEESGEVGTKASEAIAEMEEIDPQGVKRARSYLAFGMLARAGSGNKTSPPTNAADQESAQQPGQDTKSTSIADAEKEPVESPAKVELAQESTAEQNSDTSNTDNTASEANQASANNTETASDGPSRTLIITIPIIVVLVLMALFGLLLRGADVRSHDQSQS